jgi:hypothetical protein
VLDLNPPGRVLVDGQGVDHPDRVAFSQPFQLGDDLTMKVGVLEPQHDELNRSKGHSFLFLSIGGSHWPHLPTGNAERKSLGGHLRRRTVPPCLGTCGGGGPRLLPSEPRDFTGRLLELVHSPPSRRNDRGTDQQHAGEPQETADPDQHTTYDESPVQLDFPVGCRIAHNASLVQSRTAQVPQQHDMSGITPSRRPDALDGSYPNPARIGTPRITLIG